MRSIFYILLVFTLFAVSCTNRNNESDAYGNFTATEILISSETSGKVVARYVNEGENVDSGAVVFIIDTLQNYFKIKELQARKSSIEAKKSNLSAQIAVLSEQRNGLVNDVNRFRKMLSEGAASQKQIDDLSNNLKRIVREAIPIAAILLPVGFFLSVLEPNATEPNALIYLAYLGAVLLAIGLIILGIGLIRNPKQA
jgi:HlyD family secretion protein